ncbi:MAG: hypothetical protein HYZ93_02945 [Candidatus Omnitrophica bacterium]|nr:hypothetical protein [Candidatus Omnitrophota bacterium]
MLELGRRELHLVSGLGVQVIVVVLLVFAYTQAARQLSYQREKYLELREQLASAKHRLATEGKLDLNSIRARLADLGNGLPTGDSLGQWGQELAVVARDRFHLEEVQVQVGTVPESTVSVPLVKGSPFEVELYSLELSGKGGSRDIAAFLQSLGNSSPKLLCPLQGMEIRESSLHLKWLLGARRSELKEHPGIGELTPVPSSSWGEREEPFLSPFLHPEAIRVPAEILARFQLTGILWSPTSPSCVINGNVLRPGDLLGDHRLVLLTQHAALLEEQLPSKETREELFLPHRNLPHRD